MCQLLLAVLCWSALRRRLSDALSPWKGRKDSHDLLPIVARELRVAARRRGTYWVRTGAALLVMVVGIWVYLMMQTESPKDIAMVLFGVLTGGAVVHCWLSGVRATADCLSQEKREGTLGLLFLTDLKGYDVVLGKLAASSLNSLYGVLAVVPMLAIPLLLGGLTGAEFWRMALVALNTLFFSLTLGICVSSMCRSRAKRWPLPCCCCSFSPPVCRPPPRSSTTTAT